MAKKVDTSAMIFVGKFSQEDCRTKKDKEVIAAKKALYPEFKYVHSEYVMKGKTIVGLNVWLSKHFVL